MAKLLQNTIKQEMQRVASLKQKELKEYTQELNDAPCSICGSKEFIQKFRNVVGEISGSMQGYFSLFGGSISGSIDGYTKTLPVLSCRKCENERKIAVWKHIYAENIFWDFMYEFYFKVDMGYSSLYKIDPFFLERPIETRKYMLENPNWEYEFYNEIPDWNTEIWANAGFKISKVKKRYFIFWKKEVYPNWKDLELNRCPECQTVEGHSASCIKCE